HGIFTHEVQHNFGWGHKEQLPNGGGDDVMKLDSTYPGRAKWKPTVVGKDKIYLQYFEGKKPEPPKK
ncbi:MAG: hypothetical protein LBV28_05055, partial [Puniceicoccales bacterium]|nr:hypothetical protein [Puniceicoccales bacterium]